MSAFILLFGQGRGVFGNHFSVLSLCCASWIGISAQAQIAIQFDFSRSTGTFFDDLEKRTVLQAAANSLTERIGDNLSAIIPGGRNDWNIQFYDPSNLGNTASIINPSVSANTLVVYVGALAMDATILGQGGPGGWSASGGRQSWYDTIGRRGQSGITQNPDASTPTATDFAPWGGSIVFNSSINWFYNLDPSGLASQHSEYDFYSVAVHELGHVLGFGTSDSWRNQVSGSVFTGADAVSLYHGNVPVNSGADHWAANTMSYIGATGVSQAASMGPYLAGGAREYFTELDFQALGDIGWQISAVPEPSECAVVVGIALFLFAGTRRRSAA